MHIFITPVQSIILVITYTIFERFSCNIVTPNCILEVNNIEATCNCTSNPPAYKYIVSTDGKMEVRKTINLEDLGGSSISCTGVNYIGVGTSKAIVVESATGQLLRFNVFRKRYIGSIASVGT